MRTRRVEIVLVLAAATLFIWGVVRAMDRGDAVVESWTTYVMAGLIVLAGSNIAIRSRQIASGVMAVSVLFLLMALAAAVMDAHRAAAVIRSLVFLGMLALAGWMQLQVMPVGGEGEAG